DVHHADSTDQKSDGCDDNCRKRNRAHYASELIGNRFGAGNSEAVLLVVSIAATAAHQPANLILGLRLSSRIRLCSKEMLFVLRTMFPVGVVRNQDGAIGTVVAQEYALALLLHADNEEVHRSNLDFISHSIACLEERVCQVPSDDGDVRAMRIFSRGVKPPIRHMRVVNLFVI